MKTYTIKWMAGIRHGYNAERARALVEQLKHEGFLWVDTREEK